MEQIKLFLGKFKDLAPADADLKAALIKIIEARFHTTISPGDIKVANWNIYLKAKPILKSEIFLHREAILSDLATLLGKKTPEKII